MAEWTVRQKRYARSCVNVEVRFGRMPHPNTLPCTDCGHVWRRGERRHEYDHHLGYSVARMLEVQPVCTACHARRGKRLTCRNGHPNIPENRIEGGKTCRICRRARDRVRRPAAYWRAYRERRAHG